MKTKDEIMMLGAATQWYADKAELRQKYTLIVVIRDNAGENTSKAIKDVSPRKALEIISQHHMSRGRSRVINQVDYIIG